MIMRRGVLLFILFLALSNCFSQVSFSGKIVDEKSEVVPGATVALLNMNVTTLTNAQGQFTLTAFPGTYWLQVSATGYASISQQVNISKESSVLTITLQPSFVRLDEVVVSAEKKEELLQTLPLSITALTSRQVKEYRIWNIQELTAIAPTFYSADPGDKRNVSSIRGVTTTSYDPAIATYVDGVNQFNLDTYIPHLFDVERIEVLRGPQGTLYGRNAMGGVVNIITKQPTNYTNGFAEVNIGNHNQQRYIASIRTPLIKDKLFLGIAGMYDKMDGFYTNDFDNSHFDKQSSTAGNFYLKFLPSADWAVTLNVKQVFNRNNGPFSLVFGTEEALKNPFHLNQNATTKLIDNVANYSLAINHTGRMMNFSSQTSYQSNYRYYEAPIDGDFSPIDGVTIINNYGKDWNNVKAVTQEFKFTSPASSVSPLQWTAGTYLFYQNSPNKQATHFGEDALLLGSPDKNFSLINTTKAEGRGIAFYGQATYTVNKVLDITAGIRYDYEHKQQTVLGEYQKDPSQTPQFQFRPDTSAKTNFNAFSPKLSFSYHLSEKNRVYISYARGFRAGGLTQLSSDPSQPPLYAFQPENSNNYEAGFKNIFLDNRLRLNITAFYTTINNAQVPTLILPDAITITKNAGELRSKGIELEAGASFFKGFEVTYNLGYTHAEYQSLKVSQGGSEVNLKGKRQIFTPDLTSMLAAQYSYSLNTKRDLKIILRGEWKYLGTQFFDLANTIKQSSYHLLNTRAGLTAKNFEIVFWMRNITDKKYIGYAYDFGAIHLGNPRTYGVTLTGKF